MVAAFSVRPTLQRPNSPYAYDFDRARPTFPWLSAGVLIAFVAVFVIEERLTPRTGAPLPALNLATLVALGALSRNLLLQGEAYRVLTAPFLHGNLLHLLADTVVLGLAGSRLEQLAGRAWMFILFALGGLAGAALTMMTLPPQALSIGASGGIMAMLSAWLVISFRLVRPGEKLRHQLFVVVLVAVAAVPLSHGPGSIPLDYSAHLGGGLLGGVIGLLLLLTWPPDARLPALRPAAGVLALMAGLAFVSAFYAVWVQLGQSQAVGSQPPAALYIPAALYPQNAMDERARAYDLLAQYPRDPRAHVVAARAALQRNDRPIAEYELRVAMTLANEQTSTLFPALDSTIHAMLATTVLDQGRRVDALIIAKPACLAHGDSAAPPDIAARLTKSGLCVAPHG